MEQASKRSRITFYHTSLSRYSSPGRVRRNAKEKTPLSAIAKTRLLELHDLDCTLSAIGLRTLDLSCLYTGGGSHGIEFATNHVRSIGVWAWVPGGGAVEILLITYRPYMDYSSYMETTIFRTAAMLGFRRLQSYMLPCLYMLLVRVKQHKQPLIQIKRHITAT